VVASVWNCTERTRRATLRLCHAGIMFFAWAEIACTFSRFTGYRNRQERLLSADSSSCGGGSCVPAILPYESLKFLLKPNAVIGEDAPATYACVVEMAVGFAVTVVVVADALSACTVAGGEYAPVGCGGPAGESLEVPAGARQGEEAPVDAGACAALV
jgi:hypothetical protein